MTVNDVESICHLTVELTKLRQLDCKHLCIENFAPELFGKLIREFQSAENILNTSQKFPRVHGVWSECEHGAGYQPAGWECPYCKAQRTGAEP